MDLSVVWLRLVPRHRKVVAMFSGSFRRLRFAAKQPRDRQSVVIETCLQPADECLAPMWPEEQLLDGASIQEVQPISELHGCDDIPAIIPFHGVDQSEQPNLMAGPAQLLRHFECENTSERITRDVVGTMRLYTLHFFQVRSRHIFNACQYLTVFIQAVG